MQLISFKCLNSISCLYRSCANCFSWSEQRLLSAAKCQCQYRKSFISHIQLINYWHGITSEHEYFNFSTHLIIYMSFLLKLWLPAVSPTHFRRKPFLLLWKPDFNTPDCRHLTCLEVIDLHCNLSIVYNSHLWCMQWSKWWLIHTANRKKDNIILSLYYLSIHYLYLLILCWVTRCCSISWITFSGRWGAPWTGCWSITGERHLQTCSHSC